MYHLLSTDESQKQYQVQANADGACHQSKFSATRQNM